MSLVGFKAKNHRQQVTVRGADEGVDERITPASIYDPLHAEHGFTLDVAANARNSKCDRFFGVSDNGLVKSWAGEIVWCNPPYSACAAWVEKSYKEVFEGECKKVVLLLPANRCEQSWWQKWIERTRDSGSGLTTRFLPGRPRFGWPEGRVAPKKGDRPPFGLVVVVMSKKGF